MYKTVGWGEGAQNSRVGGRVYKTVGWGEGVYNSSEGRVYKTDVPIIFF